ncbi:MAG TPA: MMPL family transporter [Candidatus Dormibacteraeota bacterium]|nr:MMPL family transporter [Candidatus Dormibacteraeota bacterium]
MRGLARFVLRHRRLVILSWVVVFIAGIAGVSTSVSRLSTSFSLPGQPGYETANRVLRTYGTAADVAPYLLTLRVPAGQRIDAAQADTAFAAVQQAVPVARVIGAQQTGDPAFLPADGRTTFAYAFIPLPTAFTDPTLPLLERALATSAPAGTIAAVTGEEALANSTGSGGGPGVLAETFIGGVGALAVLLFVFASFLALLPLVIAAIAILTTFLVVLGLTYLTDISFIVEFLVALVGLGVAIDYSLLIVTRWREERTRGITNHQAVENAMVTAGRAVVFSGLTVAIGLLALVVIPVPFLRSIGLGGMLIPVVSVAVATTLLPAFLSTIGPRVDWPHIRHENTASPFWLRWGRAVVHRRWIATGVAVVILGALFIPFLSLSVGTAKADSLASSGPAYDGWHALQASGVPDGALTPIIVLTDAASAGATATTVRSVPGVHTAMAPDGQVAAAAGTRLVLAIPEKETYNGSTVQVVRDVKTAVDGRPGVIGVTGVGALQLDYQTGVYGTFPLVLGLLIVVTYILLVRAFRSVLIPLKAIILNLASLAATFGGVVVFWQYGWGSKAVFNVAPTGSITFWLPIMIFAFLFGLSMDYEVFILSRIREEYDRTGSTNRAVIEGVGRTGRLVTSAALILFLAFLSLASGPETDIKVFATGLGFGILLDATIVRMLLVPALVSLFGEWNWYLPESVARVLRIKTPGKPDEVADGVAAVAEAV